MHSEKTVLLVGLIVASGLAVAQSSSLTVEDGFEIAEDSIFHQEQEDPVAEYSDGSWIFGADVVVDSVDETDPSGYTLNIGSANQIFLQQSGGTMDGMIDMQGNTLQSPGDITGEDIIGADQIEQSAVTGEEIDEEDFYHLSWENLDIERDEIEVEDVDLQGTDGVFLEWDAESERYNVLSDEISWTDLDIDESDVEASDVNLENVRNVDLAETDIDEILEYDTGQDGFEILTEEIQWEDLDIDESDTYQDLSEVLEEGNTAETDIVMEASILTGLPTNQDGESASSGEALSFGSANDLYISSEGGVMEGTLDMDDNDIENVGGLSGTGIVGPDQLESEAVSSEELDEEDYYLLDWENLEINQEDVEIDDVDLDTTAGLFLEWNTEEEEFEVTAADMTWSDLGIEESDTYQDLSNVLEQGNVAETDIDMDGSDIEEVENLKTDSEGCIGRYCGE